MGSTRLPGKVLEDVAGAPMLSHVMTRTARSRRIAAVVLATSSSPRDDPIADLSREHDWLLYRGDEDDVLDRVFQAATPLAPEAVVRITADCPLIDPQVIDAAIGLYDEGRPDIAYVSNGLTPATFPRGLDVEVVRFDALTAAWREDRDPAWREHVTTYVRHHPERFPPANLVHAEDRSAHRWTVDTPEDLTLVRQIFGYFGHDRFSWQDALAAVRAHPSWSAMNAHVLQKPAP